MPVLSAVKHKQFPVQIKQLAGTGVIEAIVSVFGNVDRVGDRVMPGAFKKSIEKWENSGDRVPVIFSHDWSDVWKHIGVVESMEEVPKGLKVIYTLDVEDNPTAAQVYRLLKRRSIKEHSFAYSIEKERLAKDGATDLLELDIIEIGPTLKGANSETELLAVKALVEAEAKAPPWHIEADHDECNGGYAVVLDETGEVVGCHGTETEALRHLAALYANVPEVRVAADAAEEATVDDFETKAGRRLSAATVRELSAAADQAEGLARHIRGLLSGGDSEEEGKDEDEAASGKSNVELDPDILNFKTTIERMKGGSANR